MFSVARWIPRAARSTTRAYATRNRPRERYDLTRNRPPIARKTASSSNKNGPPPAENDRTSDEEAGQPASEQTSNAAVSNALAQVPASQNDLLTPVYIPEDPSSVLKETHAAMRLLDNSAIVVQRQLEMMNVLMGFEQANKYIIMDPQGNHIGYLAEQEHGMGNAIARQMLKTHRSFTTHVFDREEKEVLRFHRPFSWINSRIRVLDALGQDGQGATQYTQSTALQGTSTQSVMNQTSANISSIHQNEMRIIGAAEQEWAPLRRKYNLYLARELESINGAPQIASGQLPLANSKALQVADGNDNREPGMLQFARVDEPFLSWDFGLKSEEGQLIGSVNRNFSGFARELFTDTGVYALRMDAAEDPAGKPVGMTLDQRAVMLATAVSIDFDYFSRHSGASGSGMWMWLPWMGGEAAGGAAAGEAGAVGAAGAAGETGIASEAGAAARGLGAGEGAIAGAGTMAGYEAMQRSRGQQSAQDADPQSPQAGDANPYTPSEQSPQQGEDVWGQGRDPWDNNGDDDFWGGGGSGSGGSGGAGGGGSSDDGGGFDMGDWL